MEKKMKFRDKATRVWCDIKYVEGSWQNPSHWEAWNGLSSNCKGESEFVQTAPTLPKLLKLLADMNIEVAEDTDKIRWKKMITSTLIEYYVSQRILIGKDETIEYRAETAEQKKRAAADLKQRRAGR